MNFEIVEQSVSFQKDKTVLENKVIASFESAGRAMDYCIDRNRAERNVFYVREK